MDYKTLEDYIKKDEELQSMYLNDALFHNFISHIRAGEGSGRVDNIGLMFNTLKVLIKQNNKMRSQLMEYINRYGVIKEEDLG